MYEEDIICFVLTVTMTVLLGILPYLMIWAVYATRKKRMDREHKIRQKTFDDFMEALDSYRKEVKGKLTAKGEEKDDKKDK